jgi:uncharacterized protein (TIGR02118 family)
MIKILILYPNKTGSHFDFAYYTETHMPRAISLLSAHPGFRSVSVERGIGGAAEGSHAEYAAICEYVFNSVEDFLEAFMPYAPELQGDIPKYTDVTPLIQFNEILISK